MKSGIYRTPNGNLIYVAKDRSIKATTLYPSSWPGTKVSHRAKDDTVLIEGTDYRCTRAADVPNGCTDFDKALADKLAQDSADADAAIAQTEREPTPLAKLNAALQASPDDYIVWPDGDYCRRSELGDYRWKSDDYEVLYADTQAWIDKAEAQEASYTREHSARFVGRPPALGMGYGLKGLSTEEARAAVEAHRAKYPDPYNVYMDAEFESYKQELRALGYRPCRKQSARKHRKQGHSVFGPGREGLYWWAPAA